MANHRFNRDAFFSMVEYREPEWNIAVTRVVLVLEALQPTILSTFTIRLAGYLCELQEEAERQALEDDEEDS